MKTNLYFLFFSLLILSVFSLSAQDKPADKSIEKAKGIFTWKGDASLAISSSYFSTYQSTGNNNNLTSIVAKLNLNSNWKKGKFYWDNELKSLYGQMHTRIRIENKTKDTIKMAGVTAKSGDLLSFTTKVGYNLTKNFNLTILGNFQSQFTHAYRDPYAEERGQELEVISNFLAPAVVNLGIGIDYKPNPHFSLYYSPLDLDVVVVRIPELREDFDVDDKGYLPEMGSFLSMSYNQDIFKNVKFSTKLQLFTNYLKNKEHPQVARPGSIDVQLWQNSLSFMFNKFMSLSINTTLKYDEDTHFTILKDDKKGGVSEKYKAPRVQYFHNIGLTLGYNFGTKKK